MAHPAPDSSWYSAAELERLALRGVHLPRPDQVAIRRDVALERLAPGARLHPFCRLSGAATRVDAGAELGAGGAVTLDNAWVGVGAQLGTLGPVTLRETACGPGTVLGCGVAEEAVFLGKESQDTPFSAGYGFRVRKGSLYEEDASSAQHTDTKMTLLFPWVTLGSSLNWCDVLVAGGVGGGPGQFSEIGSGAIHFNFTPRGDKATATLLGNAVDGVFLDRPRLFIGGNASLIGPLRAEFGAVTLAGARLERHVRAGLNPAHDAGGPGAQSSTPKLSTAKLSTAELNTAARAHGTGRAAAPDFELAVYGSLKRVFDTQVAFVGELAALDAWYAHARARVAQGHPDRAALYERGRAMVRLNLDERIAQLAGLAGRMEVSARSLALRRPGDPRIAQHEALLRRWPEIERHLRHATQVEAEPPAAFRRALEESLEGGAGDGGMGDGGAGRYTAVVRRLAPEGKAAGRAWLAEVRARVAAPEVLALVPGIRA